jgi:hypothetical protein
MKHYASLIAMFNDLHDYAVQHADGTWSPAPSAAKATHRLHCTRWNTRKLPKHLPRNPLVHPRGYALAVVALPLRRPAKRPTGALRLVAALPRPAPVYRPSASLRARRRCLQYLAVLCAKAPTKWVRTIERLPSTKLNALYKAFHRANVTFKRK